MGTALKTIAFAISIFMFYRAEGQQAGWRGPDRSGVYNESNLLKSWPQQGPKVVWEVKDIGSGFSSPTITGETIYITGKKGDNDVLTALAMDGKKKWEIAYGKASNSSFPESRCTPTFFNGRLYVVSGSGDIACIGKDGSKIWSENFFAKYEGRVPSYGISESPLIVDNKVIVTPSGKLASVVAYNIDNGSVEWITDPINEKDKGDHYVNPNLIVYGGKKMIVTLTDTYIIAINPGNGKLLWKVDYAAQNEGLTRKAHTTTPIFKDGFLFVASGYDFAALKLRLSKDGSAPAIVWKNSDMDPHTGGVVLLNNYLFSSTYDNNSKGKWACVDWNTGKTMWINEWYNKGSIISADGMLYIYEEKTGHVGLVKPDKTKLNVVSEFRVTEGQGPYWAHPVIQNGILYIRHGDVLIAYSVKAG